MDDMDMSTHAHGSTASMDSMTHPMTFFTSTNTPLYSTAWTPTTTAAYAGTCIFLILLSLTYRFFSATKAQMESRWRRQNLRRQYIVTPKTRQGRGQVSEREDEDVGEGGQETPPGFAAKSTAVLTVNGLDEHVRMIEHARGQGSERDGAAVQPFRLSVDLVRAALVTVMVAVAYLLMLAVMTFNVGYFMSVLGGAFLGELLFGRWGTHADLEHH